MTCGLATNLADAGERLAAVRAGMREGKAALASRSRLQVLAMSALGAAPLALGMLVGHHGLLRPPNVMISNVSGSPAPLYWNGARLDALYPLSIPVDGQALNITCTSTDETIAFGLTGCRHAVPGLGAMTGYLDDELRLLARRRTLTTRRREPHHTQSKPHTGGHITVASSGTTPTYDREHARRFDRKSKNMRGVVMHAPGEAHVEDRDDRNHPTDRCDHPRFDGVCLRRGAGPQSLHILEHP